jgi:hypothetical protein
MGLRRYGIRKAGTRMGQPHYSVTCNLCAPAYPLAIGYLTKDAAQRLAERHIAEVHAVDGAR